MIAVSLLAALAMQTAPAGRPEAATGDVVVVGQREPYRLSARALRAARATFGEQRARFAPASSLRFVASMRRDTAAAKPIALRLTDGTRSVPIVLDAEGVFAVPMLPEGKWWLEGNHGPRQMMVRPEVLSPGSDRHDQRLGDVRLQCRVFWAMAKAEAPLLAAPIVGMLNLAGPCSSSRIGIYDRAPRPIRAANLVEGTRVVPIQTTHGRRSYRMPASDRSFGDDARVRIELD